MRVAALDRFPYRIPLVDEFSTAHGRTAARAGLLVRLTTGSGVVGWGEAAPLPEFGGGTAADAARLLENLAPDLVGCDLDALAGLLDGLPARPGIAAVRCALDVAALDARGRAAGQPVAALLAPDPAPSVPVNATVGAAAVEDAVAAARRAVASGFRVVKLKVGMAASPEAEAERVAAVRAAIGPKTDLRLDANGAWDVDTAIATLRRLLPYRIDLVEQPVPTADLDGLARVRRAVDVPLAADEAVGGLDAARAVVARACADVLVVKPMVVGGISEGRRIAELAIDAGLTAIVTTTVDAGVCVAAALHLAATLPSPAPACGLATGGLLASDLLAAPLAVERGRMRLPGGAGLGVDVDVDELARY
ncbi:MAG TPA: o-succinylbenzoate synthase [Thermomicrobiaceae bacterium]|nr:o-succinylbenzoate synthase [Thermomicrobiaceae bacterium]